MTFHNEIYTIYKVYRGSPTVYKLIDEKDGETIFGMFYEWELQGVEENPPSVQNEEMTKGRVKGPMDKYAIKMK